MMSGMVYRRMVLGLGVMACMAVAFAERLMRRYHDDEGNEENQH
jgi:hypothetical protein